MAIRSRAYSCKARCSRSPISNSLDLVNNTPFQGSTCQHQDTGTGNFNCVTTTDLCTTSTNGNASGANCPNTGTNALITVSNTYNLDPSQKPVIAPGYIMGKDTALSCGASGDNTCKGLVNIFTSITGDALTSGGRTNNFNSILIPILGVVQPSTAATTSPALNAGWTNGPVTLNFNSTEIVPSNNQNPPPPCRPSTTSPIARPVRTLPTPATGTISGATGSITIPGTVEGTTVVTFFATDSSGTVESQITNDSGANTVSSASPTITIQVDKTAPTFSCTPPAAAWQATDVSVPCTASDNAGGSGLATPSPFNVSTAVPSRTETNTAQTPASSVADVAGNTVPVPSYGPFWVDKKAPAISTPSLSVANPVFNQSVTATYTCTDGGSGVVLCAPSQQSQQISPDLHHHHHQSDRHLHSRSTHLHRVRAGPGRQSEFESDRLHRGPGNAHTHLDDPSRNHVRNRIERNAAERDRQYRWILRLHSGGWYRVDGRNANTLRNLHSNRHHQLRTATTTVQLVVTKATPTITWATPAAITFGTMLSAAQLNATANVPGTFVYTPSAGTLLSAGDQTLSTTFTPTDAADYTTATASVPLTVNRATPTLTWMTPAPITYGTLLSAAQLNATANVAGTFVLHPGCGNGPERRNADASNHLHTHRRRRLHNGHLVGIARRQPGDPDPRLAHARIHSVRDSAQLHPTQCHRERAGSVRIHTPRRNRPPTGQSTIVGCIHSNRLIGLHAGNRTGNDTGHPTGD